MHNCMDGGRCEACDNEAAEAASVDQHERWLADVAAGRVVIRELPPLAKLEASDDWDF